jgi:hypothetical protein
MVVKSLDEIKTKWASVTGAAATYYDAGVKNPKADWATNTKAAKNAYSQGVTQAISKNLFEKGVDKAGTEKQKRKSIDIGIGRFASGVAAAVEDFGKGFEPYRSALEGITLPARYAAGDPRNIERVAKIATTLRQKKTG